jgi:ADP-heptose:LPS heptosyltransferase
LPEEREAGIAEVAAVRSGARHVIAFHPGAGKIPNRWPVPAFCEAIETLVNSHAVRIIVVKGPMDNEPVQALLSSLRVSVHLVGNRSIRGVASILSAVDLLVSNDTGVMHVGAASGVPVLSLFGPTEPAQWAPPGTKNRYLREASGNIAEINVGTVLDGIREMLPEHGKNS